MSFVTTQPETLSTAASGLASAMNALKAAVAGLTTKVVPAGHAVAVDRGGG